MRTAAERLVLGMLEILVTAEKSGSVENGT
jgi:hypothetical protein